MSNKIRVFGIFLVLVLVALCLAIYFKSEIKYFIKEYFYKETYQIEYSEQVKSASLEFDVPESMIYAVINTESHFDLDAVSSAGAVGLMQLMPETYSWIAGCLGETADVSLISDVSVNIRYGTYYLSFLLNRLENEETVYAAYNAGYSRVTGWLADSRYSEDGKTLANIPYDETSAYVKKVKQAREKYERLLENDTASLMV